MDATKSQPVCKEDHTFGGMSSGSHFNSSADVYHLTMRVYILTPISLYEQLHQSIRTDRETRVLVTYYLTAVHAG